MRNTTKEKAGFAIIISSFLGLSTWVGFALGVPTSQIIIGDGIIFSFFIGMILLFSSI